MAYKAQVHEPGGYFERMMVLDTGRRIQPPRSTVATQRNRQACIECAVGVGLRNGSGSPSRLNLQEREVAATQIV